MAQLIEALKRCTTSVEVVDLYRDGDELARRMIREFHPKMKLEFDAIDLLEWRARRLAAQQAQA